MATRAKKKPATRIVTSKQKSIQLITTFDSAQEAKQ